jgi:oligopeptide transport system substrate-binding protein
MMMRIPIFVAMAFAAALGATRCVLAADMSKTLRVAFTTAESGFDPQAASDAYSFYVCHAIFDALYTYDYFARPARMVPNTADGMPQISDGGRTYTIKVKPGIYFADDPAFNGRKRELVADDYVYSIKRIFDPKVRSYWLYLFENNLIGLDGVLARARSSGSLDYEAPIDGLRSLDKYTLRIRFKNPDYVFQWWLTFDGLAAVAREVVDAHKDESNRVADHPVGTGAYRLAQWIRGQKIVLEANPDFRSETFPVPSLGSEPGDAALARENAGKKLPIVGRVEISIIEEAQPRLLTFDSGELDYVELPSSIAGNVLTDSELKPEYAKRGIRLHRQIEPALDFTFFNMDNPVVGGYSNDKIALRRAISMGYDRAADIKLIANGQGVPATQPVPPGLAGFDPSIPPKNGYDPKAARVLLDKFGYKDRDGEGYRKTPEGKPLTLIKASATTNVDRSRDELWKRSMDAIGIRITFLKQKWPELNKMSEAGQLMMWNLAWITSLPDGDSFYSVLYSKNIGTSNDARLRLPEFDRLYEDARKRPDGPQRNAIYRKLTELVQNYAPWVLGDYPYSNVLAQPWLKGYKQHPFVKNEWKYYDIDRP